MDVASSSDSSSGEKSSSDSIRKDNDDYREYEQCGCQIGCGGCKTKRWPIKIFSCCNNPKGALFFLCCVAFVQGFVINGLINIVISTLERRFGLRSWETGLVASSYDIATCVCLLVVTYVGGRGHKPMWLGWGVVILGLGSIVFSLPHFIAPAYSIAGMDSGCSSNNANCVETSIRIYRAFFIVSQLLHGIGAAPLYTLGLTYLDENVKQRYSSVYHGIFYGLSVVGPGVGYLVGGYFLTVFTNIDEMVSITDSDPLWVGNWWIGFLIGGSCFLVLSIPILMFPRQLPGTDAVRQNRENEIHRNAVKVKGDENFGKSIRDAPRCLLVLLKNPTLVFVSLSGAMNNGIVAGIATFGPKYLEAMFSVSPSFAAFAFGVLAIVTSFLGQIIGGLMVWKFRLTVPKMLIMSIVFSFISFGCLFVYLYSCANTEFAGATIPYTGLSQVNCTSSVSQCGCSTELYDPVCGSDNLTYLSYCDAGCNSSFADCKRVMTSNIPAASATATRGKCATDACQNIMLFLIVSGVGVFFLFLTAMPSLQTSMRCVPFSQRSFAIGVQWLILRLLGSVPMPIIIGRVLDQTCLVWDEQCEECGSCKVYDNTAMAKYMVTVATVVKGLSTIFLLVAWGTYKAPPAEELSENNQRENMDTPLPNGAQEAHVNPAFSL